MAFLNYIKQSQHRHNILDLGCGNGWLSYKMALLQQQVVGVDVNLLELEQAEQCLQGLPNTKLILGDIFKIPFEEKFSIIVMNAAFQYFPKPQDLIRRLLTLLSTDGEIHIMDSPIYKKEQVAAARSRSHKYYEENGQAEMKDFYFHQSWANLEDFDYKILYDPSLITNRLKRKVVIDSPFPWIKIISNA